MRARHKIDPRHGLVCVSLFVLIACNSSALYSGLEGTAATQSTVKLSIKTVSSQTAARVYELDQRRGTLVKTTDTIAPGQRLVTLAWGAWDIIATDPVRLLPAHDLSGSQADCPLSIYPFDAFRDAPDFSVVGTRLARQETGQFNHRVRPMLFGKHFGVADSASGVFAKASAALIPKQQLFFSSATDATWMPEPAQVWLSELNIPSPRVDQLVNDNAFLDFAACYIQDQPNLANRAIASASPDMLLLPNGQHVVISFRGYPVRGFSRTLDAAMYEIDRDVLRFGLVPPARFINHATTGTNLLLGKRFFGLEEGWLKQQSSAYRASSEFNADEIIVELIRHVAATEMGYKVALFELLFNEYDRYGLHNQILTATGGVVLFDHERPDPWQSPIPCYPRLNRFRDQSNHAALSALYDAGRYAEFEQEFRSRLNIPVRVYADGTLFDATQFYLHLLEAGSVLPQVLRQKLEWILEHRAQTEPIMQRLFHHVMGLQPPTFLAVSREKTSLCLFYARIEWLVANQRLPTEAEGISIMQTCGLKPNYSCRI